MSENEYKPCESCGANCYKFFEKEEQKLHPCWGRVYAVDEIWDGEDTGWIHACKGHYEEYVGREYAKKPTDVTS